MAAITFRQLEVFVAAVEAGSFRACAEALSISQMSVSEHIRTLEHHLGFTLFHRRGGHSAALTDAGERTYREAKEIIAKVDHLVASQQPHLGRSRKIRIGAHAYIAETLTPRLATFMHDHPSVEIELQRQPFEGVSRGLAKAELDVGFFFSYGPAPELKSAPAWVEELGLYVAVDHPLASHPGVSQAQLGRHPFVYLPSRSHLCSQIDQLLSDAGLNNCPVAMRSDDHGLIVSHLREGRSFGCLFKRGADDLVARRLLSPVRLAFELPPIGVRVAVFAAHHQDALFSELIARLVGPKTAPNQKAGPRV